MIEVKNFKELEELFKVVHTVKCSIEEYVSDATGDFDSNAIQGKILSYLKQKGIDEIYGIYVLEPTHRPLYDDEEAEYTFVYRVVVGYRCLDIAIEVSYKTIDKSIDSKVYINDIGHMVSALGLD